MIPRYTRPEMASIWSDENRFKLWLEVETHALEAVVNLGIAPQSALDDVRAKGNFDADRVLEIEKEVKHDVIAFLTNVAEYVGEGARYLHYGMTSSDLLDTSFAVQLVQSTDLILKGLDELSISVKDCAEKYKDVVCVGRSHGIHAEPTTFGLKVAVWYDELARHKKRIEFAREDIAVGAISGPVGTYAHLSPEVEKHVCDKLGLKPANISTQVIQRDAHAALFSAFAQLGGTLEKISVEIRHLQRTEVREAEEPFSKDQKGSSAMPHKRNPILTENATGLARLLRAWADAAMENVALWHERDISHSSVERVVAPDATITLDFMMARIRGVIEGLQVYPNVMKKNLELTNGLVYSGAMLLALAAKGVSREKAYRMVQKNALATWDAFSEEGVEEVEFKDLVLADKEILSVLNTDEIEEVFSLERYLQHTDYIFNNVFGS